MQFGLLISVLLHAAILGGAVFSIQSRQQLRVPELQPVAVGMISPSDVTKVRMGERTAKQLEAMAKESAEGRKAKKKASKARTAAAAPPPPPPPAPKRKSEPAAGKSAPPPAADRAAEARKKAEAEQQERARKAAEQKKTEERKRAEAQKRAEEERRAQERKKAEERKQAEARKKAEEQRRQAELKKKKREAEKKRQAAARKKRREAERRRKQAEAAKKEQFTDKIAALLNKVPDAALPPASAPPTKPTKSREPSLGAPEGRDKQISASELAMIVQAIRTCVTANWRVLSGGASAQETVVKIRLRFNQDGTLSEPPQVMNPQRTPYFVAISESARRAVRQCEPYDLPPAKYEVWKDLVMNFSPTDMY